MTRPYQCPDPFCQAFVEVEDFKPKAHGEMLCPDCNTEWIGEVDRACGLISDLHEINASIRNSRFSGDSPCDHRVSEALGAVTEKIESMDRELEKVQGVLDALISTLHAIGLLAKIPVVQDEVEALRKQFERPL